MIGESSVRNGEVDRIEGGREPLNVTSTLLVERKRLVRLLVCLQPVACSQNALGLEDFFSILGHVGTHFILLEFMYISVGLLSLL